MKAWPRLWHNLCASRETELANEYPIHVVAEWLGNSPTIAAKHYLKVTESHFDDATKPKRVVQGVVPHPAATSDNDGNHHQLVLKKPRGKRQKAVSLDVEQKWL